MQKKKLQDLRKPTINKVTLFGRLTQKSNLLKSKKGNYVIKFVLSKTAYCICAKEYAQMVNILDLGTKLLVEGEIMLFQGKNIVYAKEVESYTTQNQINTKKIRKELKIEQTEF